MSKKRVAIAGASGYAGYELVKILSRHPQVEITSLAIGEDVTANFSDIFPALKGICDLPCQKIDPDGMIDQSDLIFFALPHKVSMQVIPSFIDRVKVIDLSADYRMKDAAMYARAYGVAHADASHLGQFVYGLPEAYRSSIQHTTTVANPGCFPTGIILALQPVLRQGWIDGHSIRISSMTGVSGGGRAPRMEFHFPECHENITAYKVGKHQHEPEIEQELSIMAGEEVDVVFVPHLSPLIRGIYSTIYAELKQTITQTDLVQFYREFYHHEPFIRIMEATQSPQIKHIVGSNFCDIGLAVCGRTLILMSVIDNLVKGAAGQAVQNMNLMFGFEETCGLL